MNLLISESIRFVLNQIFAIMPIIAILLATLNLRGKNRLQIVDRYLGYLLSFGFGILGLWGFIMHAFFPGIAAEFIGWQTSPFQFEVAMANLGVGVTGLLAWRSSFGFRVAATLNIACFYWGDAVGHIIQMLNAHNFAPGNAGSVFYVDIIAPALLIMLLIMRNKLAYSANK